MGIVVVGGAFVVVSKFVHNMLTNMIEEQDDDLPGDGPYVIENLALVPAD